MFFTKPINCLKYLLNFIGSSTNLFLFDWFISVRVALIYSFFYQRAGNHRFQYFLHLNTTQRSTFLHLSCSFNNVISQE